MMDVLKHHEDAARKAGLTAESDREQAIAEAVAATRQRHLDGVKEGGEVGKLHNKAFRLFNQLNNQPMCPDPALKAEYGRVTAEIVETEKPAQPTPEQVDPEAYDWSGLQDLDGNRIADREPKEGTLSIAEWHKLPDEEKVRRASEVKRSSRATF